MPEVVLTAPADGGLAYRGLPSIPLLELPSAERDAHGPALAAELGRLLRELHTAPPPAVASLNDTPPADWRAEAAEHFAAVAHAIPPAHHPPIEAFLAHPAPPRLGFSHDDLGIEHVLVDPAKSLAGLRWPFPIRR